MEKAGQGRRRFYKLTSAGRAVMKEQRDVWRDFIAAVGRIT